MPNVVRFALDSARDVYVPGVGWFIAGIHDVDADNIRAIGRARFLVQPFRAVEIGVVDSEDPPPNLPPAPEDIVSIPDPYPQYVTPDELETRLAGVSGGSQIVVHGSNANVSRPAGTNPVVWFGTVNPANADPALDVWVPVTNSEG